VDEKVIQKNGFMSSYSTNTFRRIFEEFRNTILLKYCNDPNNVVCSLGAHNDMLADEIKFKELYLIDLEFGKCKYKSNPNIRYWITSVENIFNYNYFNNKFDVVIMKDLIEHLEPYLANIVLTNIHTILKPNGIFILTYPNARSTNRLIGTELGMLLLPGALSDGDIKVGHKKMYCYNDLAKFEKLINMEKIQDIGIMFKPLSNAQMDKYFIKNLDMFIEIGYDIGAKVCCHIGGVFKNVP